MINNTSSDFLSTRFLTFLIYMFIFQLLFINFVKQNYKIQNSKKLFIYFYISLEVNVFSSIKVNKKTNLNQQIEYIIRITLKEKIK